MTMAEPLQQAATVKVHGREYTVSPLTPGDFARAEQHIRDTRRNSFLSGARHVNLTEEVRAKALAEIECKPVSFSDDVLGSIDGQLFIVWLAMKAETRPTFDMFKIGLSSEVVERLATVVLQVTGLLNEEVGGDPLARTDTTTTEEATTRSTGQS